MIIYLTNEDTDEVKELQGDSFYKTIAEYLQNIKKGIFTAKIKDNDNDYITYQITQRSGTQFIIELDNQMSNIYLDKNINDVMLTCVDSEKNAYKYYKLVVKGNMVTAYYGRMGTVKGELFGERSYDYPLSMYWIKYYEKIGKGYVDRTDIYLDSELAEKKDETETDDSPAGKLFAKLLRFSKRRVRESGVKVPISPKIISVSKETLEKMRVAAKAKDIDSFNKHLLELMAILQRPVGTGSKSAGVASFEAKDIFDFARILDRENDLILAMEGSSYKKASTSCFKDCEVYIANDKQKEQVLSHLSKDLIPKVKTIYRVIPQEQQNRFNKYIKENNITEIKQLWHGSRNENWLSIINTGLVLNPNAVITGKMFGQGIYFAPSSMKSWGYTSYSGSYWANGSSKTAYMGLYACAYGKPYEVFSFNNEPFEKNVKSGGYNCLHAKASKGMLRNDEIVFYNERATVLNYIVEFGE